MNSRSLNGARIVALAAFITGAQAEDIDLFVGFDAAAGQVPNVVIVLDNAANFSSSAKGSSCVIDGTATALSGTVGGVEQCALYQVISELDIPIPEDDGPEQPPVNIGMMVYNANNIRDINNLNCGGSVGGCLAYPLTPMTTANRATLLAWIKSWRTSGGSGDGYIKANGEATGAAMQETWAYFAGRTGLSGRSYADIKPVLGCGKNYVVFVGNSYDASGSPGDATGSKGPRDALQGTNPTALMNASPAATADQKSLITNTVKSTCGTYTFPTSAHENKGFYPDEWSRYLASQNIVTYAIGVLGAKCQAEYAGMLTNMANYGGGKYYPTTTYDELSFALGQVLSEVQAANSAFASVSLPVSVNTQGTYLNQVFIGMFRPDADALPRWAGNLKQYKIGFDNAGTLRLLDADDAPAISSNDTGFIAECARSFWTPTVTDSYWEWLSKEHCLGVSAKSNSPDGNIVEKGGEGYKLRAISPASRRAKTCTGECQDVADFDVANGAITKALLGDAAMSSGDREALIHWARGSNNKGDETFQSPDAMRPSVHGDVVHSRPVAVNFSTTDTEPEVVVFYGGNDGVLRAINGNRDGGLPIDSIPPGGELWAFVAPEFFGKIERLRENEVQISFKGMEPPPADPDADDSEPKDPEPKPYGFDGPVTAYKDAERAWIFATLRRGGRALYAFDVTNPASPSKIPGWTALRLGCPKAPDTTECTSSDFNDIGQTWSAPRVLKAAGHDAGASPLLIMGGGYDPCEDFDAEVAGGANHECTASSKGDQIYVLDAATGAVLKPFDLGTGRGVAGDVTVVPDGVTGMAKYAYAADLGGNVWRVSGADANSPIGTTAPQDWTITKIASLGCDTPGVCTANRKFMFAPDVVEEAGYYYVMLGSGDREKPLMDYEAARSVTNYFFMLRDKPDDPGWLGGESGACGGASLICIASLLPIEPDADPTEAELASKPKGWYLGLAAGEQVVTSGITLFGTVTFSTHEPTVPNPETCTTDLGTARSYNIRYLNAASAIGAAGRFQEVEGGGLAPSPVAGVVRLDDGTEVPFVIGGSPDSHIEVSKREATPPEEAGGQPKARVYWYIER